MCNKCLREEAEYRATGKRPPSGGGGCAGWPAVQIGNVSGEYPPIGRVVHVEPNEEPSLGGHVTDADDPRLLRHPSFSQAIVDRIETVYDRLEPRNKIKVTINNNIPNSTVTVQEVDGEIIVTITEAPEKGNYRSND